MKKLKAEMDHNHDAGVAHKRQMQQMKQSVADHEKTKLKLRAAELKAEDANEVGDTLWLRERERERVGGSGRERERVGGRETHANSYFEVHWGPNGARGRPLDVSYPLRLPALPLLCCRTIS